MEHRLWPRLYDLVVALGKTHRRGGNGYSDAAVVVVFLWAVLHDRPTTWALDRDNWPAAERWQWDRLPSDATMSRRLRTIGVLTLMEQVEAKVRDVFPRGLMKMIDAKPLPVGGATKDPDADCGRGASGKAVGYKIHVAWDANRVVDVWQLAPMSTNEKAVAPALIGRLEAFAYAVADNQYDGNPTFDLVAARGGQLIVCRRTKVPAGLGHRKQSPHRLRGLDLARNPLGCCGGPATSFGQDLLHGRDDVERCFAALGNFGGGLGPLPNWVRRPRRVARWVWGKLLIYHVRLAVKQRLVA